MEFLCEFMREPCDNLGSHCDAVQCNSLFTEFEKQQLCSYF